MNALITIFIILHGVLAPLHDVPLAQFQIEETNNIVQINMIFDKEDFSESTGIVMSDLNRDRIENYLKKNTSFQFNSEIAELNISRLEVGKDHIKVFGDFGKVKDEIKDIKIENTCLIDISGHSNLIQIDLNNMSRDFRMHKKRTVIQVSY